MHMQGNSTLCPVRKMSETGFASLGHACTNLSPTKQRGSQLLQRQEEQWGKPMQKQKKIRNTWALHPLTFVRKFKHTHCLCQCKQLVHVVSSNSGCCCKITSSCISPISSVWAKDSPSCFLLAKLPESEEWGVSWYLCCSFCTSLVSPEHSFCKSESSTFVCCNGYSFSCCIFFPNVWLPKCKLCLPRFQNQLVEYKFSVRNTTLAKRKRTICKTTKWVDLPIRITNTSFKH